MALLTAALTQRLLGYLDGRAREPLFASTGGTPLRVRRIRSTVGRAAHRASIQDKRLSPHIFRYAWATWAWNPRMPIETSRAFMGYGGPRIVRVSSPVTLDTPRADYESAMSAIADAGPASAGLERIRDMGRSHG
jgi:hypothetical protein